jgi:hypothetical protein
VEGPVNRGRPTAWDLYADWCHGTARVKVSFGEWMRRPGVSERVAQARAERAEVVETAPGGS